MINNGQNNLLLATAIALLAVANAHADLSLSGIGQSVSIDFKNYSGSGLQPGGSSGTLNSDHWALYIGDSSSFSETNPGDSVGSGEFGRGSSTGSIADSGFYALETGGANRALGVQLVSTGFSFAGFNLRVRNDTGYQVDNIHVSYEIWVKNDSDNSNYFDLEFSDDSDYIDPVWFETPYAHDAASMWTKTDLEFDLFLPTVGNNGGTIEALDAGDSLWVNWVIGGEFNVLNGYNEVALDNVRITAFSSSVPQPQSLLIIGAVGLMTTTRRRHRTA